MERRTIFVEPRFSDLECAKGIYDTELGPVVMKWPTKAARLPGISCVLSAKLRRNVLSIAHHNKK